MSIIYSYPEQGQLNADDMFIGTSAVTVGGKQKNITRNFTVQQIADFINQGAGFVDPLASDFQIPVFNQEGKKITGSIMSQNIYPNGSAITIAGSLTVNTNLTASGSVTLGSGANNIILQSPTTLGGPIKDSSNTLGVSNQILISNSLGNLVWQNYEAGLTYEGTWNASTNTPALTSGQGVSGHFYIVNVAGNTNLDGNNDWHVGDWAVFFDAGGGGTAAWQKIDNTSVLTGSGTPNTFAMWTATETLNDSLLSQDAGATKVIVDGLLEVKGDGASQDGRIKLNCSQNSHGVTIQSPPHSAGASYTLLLPTSVGTSGQTLTTDGSDPAQLTWTNHASGTVTGTGTQNYVTKWSAGGTGIEDSTIFDNGTNVGIGTTSPSEKLEVAGSVTLTASSPFLKVDGSGHAGITIDRGSTSYDANLMFATGGSTNWRIWNDGSSDTLQIRDEANADNVMTWETGGNVGIGTTSPRTKLHVTKTGGGAPPVLGADAFTAHLGAGLFGTLFSTLSSGKGVIQQGRTDGTATAYDLLLQPSGGNVGIGTDSPDTELHLKGFNPKFKITNTNTTATGYHGIVFESLDTAGFASQTLGQLDFTSSIGATGLSARIKAEMKNSNGGGEIVFSTGVPGSGGNERMRIDATGNVGIGTNSPAVSLDINATDAVQMPAGTTTERGNITSPADGMFRYNNTSNSFEGYINGNWGAIGGGSSGGLVFRGTFDASTGSITGGGSLYTCPTGGPGGTVDIAVGDLYIVTTAGSFYCSGTNLNVGDEVICVTAATAGNSSVTDWNAVASGGGGLTGSGTTNYIPKFTGTTVVGNSSIYEDANSNVGIGTTSPTEKLDVDGAIRANGNIEVHGGGRMLVNTSSSALRFGTSNAERMRIDSSGNVGIGTTSPGQKLDVLGSIASNSIYLYDSTSNDRLVLDLDASDNIKIATGTSTGDRGITFFTENSEKMRIDSDGNVGIGTDQPEVSLDLGNNTDALQLPAGDNTARAAITNPFGGMIRYNTTDNQFEGYSGVGAAGSWGALGGGGAPTITKQLFQVITAQSIFTLTGVNPQDANYVNIFIDGVYQNSGTYTVATATGTTTVTLNTDAPAGTSVEIISTT